MRVLLLALLACWSSCADDAATAENELGGDVTCYQTRSRGIANCLGKKGHFVCFTTAGHGAACLRAVDVALERP